MDFYCCLRGKARMSNTARVEQACFALEFKRLAHGHCAHGQWNHYNIPSSRKDQNRLRDAVSIYICILGSTGAPRSLVAAFISATSFSPSIALLSNQAPRGQNNNTRTEVYALDGSVIDTTGIVALLLEQRAIIIAFYNNNVPLSDLASPFAYLFGVDAPTDAMNSLCGPQLGQVFDSKLYPQVFRNISHPPILRAHLTNVRVRSNHFLGIKGYRLKHLYIIGNTKSEAFTSEGFTDRSIVESLDQRWPDHFLVDMPILDANVLCAFCDWKVNRFEHELSRLMLDM